MSLSGSSCEGVYIIAWEDGGSARPDLQRGLSKQVSSTTRGQDTTTRQSIESNKNVILN